LKRYYINYKGKRYQVLETEVGNKIQYKISHKNLNVATILGTHETKVRLKDLIDIKQAEVVKRNKRWFN
jgi:hypothetical protein